MGGAEGRPSTPYSNRRAVVERLQHDRAKHDEARYERGVQRNQDEVELVPATARLPYPARDVVEALGPLVTDARLARFREILARRTRSLIPVLDGLSDPHNGAAILRSADAFGCHEVHTVEGRFPFAISHRISRGTQRWLNLIQHKTGTACCDVLEARGYEIFVAAMEGTVTPEDLAKVPKAAVVFGNEHRGVSSEIRSRAKGVYRIPMVGFVESLNVSVASAITLYTASQGRHGDLSAQDQEEALARFLLSQVRDADRIVRSRLSSGGSDTGGSTG